MITHAKTNDESKNKMNGNTNITLLEEINSST